jgi:hypothetical protein
MAEALADPLRADVFDVLSGWRPNATVGQIAELLGHPAREIARAIAVLEQCDLVEPLGNAPPHPGDSAPYRTTRDGWISDEEWAEFPPDLRRRLLARTLDKMYERIRSAVGRGGFDGPDAHVSWLPTDLDGIGYQDMVRLINETLSRARDIQVAAVERRAAGTADDEEIKTSVMLIHFVEPTGAGGGGEPSPTMLDRIYALTSAIADEVPGATPDWEQIAESAMTLAALARRRSQAGIVS